MLDDVFFLESSNFKPVPSCLSFAGVTPLKIIFRRSRQTRLRLTRSREGSREGDAKDTKSPLCGHFPAGIVSARHDQVL